MPAFFFSGKQDLLFPGAEPDEAIDDQLVLLGISEGPGQCFIGLVLVIDIVVPHVEIHHPVIFIAPHHGIIAAMPDFMGLGPCAEWKTC